MKAKRLVLKQEKAGAPKHYRAPKKPAGKMSHRQGIPSVPGLELILDNIPDIFWVIEPEGWKYTYISPAFETITGYKIPKDSSFPTGILDLVLPEDRHILLDAWQKADQTPKFDIQYRIRCADGRVLWIRDKGSAVFNRDGKLIQLAGTARDRTSQKDLQAALSETESRLKLLAENMDEIFWIRSHRTGKIVYTSPAFSQIWGLDSEKLSGLSAILEKIHPDDRLKIKAALKSQELGERTSIEFRVLQQDGSYRWLWDRSFPIFAPDSSNGEGKEIIQTGGLASDISRLKRVQEQLKQANDVLGEQVNTQFAEILDIYEHAPIGYHSVDANGIFVMVNQTELDWLGYDRDELLGKKHIITLLTAESEKKFSEHFSQFKKSGSLKNLELEFIRKDGTIFPVLANAAAIYDADGNYHMSRSAILDISDLKKMQATLVQKEKTFRAIFENSNDAIILVTPQGYKLDANLKALSLLGYTREEFMNLPYDKLVPKEQLQDAAEKYLLAINSKNLPLIERTWLTKSGERIEVEINLSPIFNDRGELIMVQNLARDVTERNKAQAEIVAQRDFAGQVMDAMGQGLLVSDADGKVEYLNPALKLMLGMDPQNGLHGEYERFTSREYQEGVVNHLLLGRQGTPLEFDYVMHTNSGEDRNMRITVTPRWKNEEVIGTIAVFTDLSREKEVEKNILASRDQLRLANAALEKAARMKDEFLASMSHELRTPLTGILGLSEIMRLGMYGELSEKQLKAIQNIEQSGRVLLDLINDILDLSRIESGTMELAPAACSLDDVCRSSVRMVSGMVNQKNQAITYAGPGNNVIMMADSRRIKQILVSLLRNAVKFTPDNGSLGLIVKVNEENSQVDLCVWDTGIGISKEDQTQLFIPFLQLDGRLQRKYSGVGLGLALVNRLVEMHGGKINVDSEPGLGSRFTVTLPIEAVSEEQSAGFISQGISENKGVSWKERVGEVLVISGRQAGSDKLIHALSNLGIRSRVCGLAEDIPGLAVEMKPGIILMEVEPPCEPVFELLGRLKADERTMAVPVLMIRPEAVPGDETVNLEAACIEAIRLGAAGILVEPISLILLRKELDNLVKRE